MTRSLSQVENRASTVFSRQCVERPDFGSAVDALCRDTGDSKWLLLEEGFTLTREHEFESLFAISNGYVGNRGSPR